MRDDVYYENWLECCPLDMMFSFLEIPGMVLVYYMYYSFSYKTDQFESYI